MRYDKPLVAAIIGGLSTIPYEVITLILVSIGIGKYGVYNLTSLIVTLNRPISIMGLVLAFVVGGGSSLVFYYSLKKLGWDYLLAKSIMFSLFVWVLMEAVFVWLIEGPNLIQPRPISDYYIHMAGSILFGTTLGLLFQKYLKNSSQNHKRRR